VQRKSFNGNWSRKRFALTVLPRILLTALLVILFSGNVLGSEPPNRLKRMEVRSKERFTRFLFVFHRTPRYTLTYLPDRRVQLTFHETAGAVLKKYRSFSDARVSDVSLSDRGDRLRLRFSLKEKSPGIRILDSILPNVVTLDVGEALQRNGAASMPPGRERIWSGAGALVHEFEPSHTSDLPFFPTPGTLIRKLLAPADAKLFARGEDALYRERGAEAEEIFTTFVNQGNLMRAIASYRLGEAQYLLQKFESALRWFREGERLQPEFMVQSPSIVFSYADTLVRNGEFAAGRRMLERLTVGMADTKYGPLLLVRMADVMTRSGKGMEALALYRTVAEQFPSTRGAPLASLRLADRRFFQVSADTYRGLSGEYLKIAGTVSDPILKEEALFKGTLLEAMYGSVADAVAAVAAYEKKYPAGVFMNVARTMREDLLVLMYRELDRAGDCRGLARLALDNREYLARCTAEQGFISRIDECFRKLGMIREELDLFCLLVETEWSAASAPFLYYRIFDASLELGDPARAEAAGKVFLARFGSDGRSGTVRERLAGIQFRNRDMHAVFSTLSPLLSGNGTALFPESYYYFGKACASVGDPARAERAMIRFLAAGRNGAGSFLTSDARMVAASAMLARKDAVGAMEMYRAGYETCQGEQREMFLYKMGVLSRREGRRGEARSRWEQLIREGKDPVWTRMASQALADMQWSEKWGPGGTSK
jgi:TolA-binding protein